MNKVLGIDLGTTYSCVAYIDENNKPVVLKNSEGDLTTPSVVYFEDGNEVLVGESAKESSKIYPEKSVAFIKRSMGQPNANVFVNDKEMTPPEVSSYILKKIVTDACDTLRMEGKISDEEDIKDVVITCPAYFGINERSATKTAGELAGLNVLQIINEPTAAAITYGVADNKSDKVVLVYDLGGGTFDVTIIHIKPGEIDVVCTGGDHTLGGKDWDDTIIMYVDDEFCRQTGTSESILDDPETLQEITLSVEKAKKLLTSKEKAPISVNYKGKRARIELTREKFDELTKPLLDRTIALTQDMIKEAGKKGYSPDSIDEILLVGGSSKMPQVEKIIKETFSKEPKMFDPDEAVAKGAAIFASKENEYNILLDELAAATGQDKNKLKDDIESGKTTAAAVASAAGAPIAARRLMSSEGIKIKNVSSRSFGTIALNNNGEEKLFNIIFKNDSLPKESTQSFYPLADGQKDIRIRVLENLSSDAEIDPGLGSDIGEAQLTLPSDINKSTVINITFKLNTAGLLEIKATETKENTSVESKFEVKEDLGEEEKTEAMRRVSDANLS